MRGRYALCCAHITIIYNIICVLLLYYYYTYTRDRNRRLLHCHLERNAYLRLNTYYRRHYVLQYSYGIFFSFCFIQNLIFPRPAILQRGNRISIIRRSRGDDTACTHHTYAPMNNTRLVRVHCVVRCPRFSSIQRSFPFSCY